MKNRSSIARVTHFLLTFGVMVVFAIVAGSATAHNLQTKMVYMFFDPDTQQLLDDRIDGLDTCFPSHVAPDPLLHGAQLCDDSVTPYFGDELGIIIKVIPRDGTTTGVGGHVDFYVPDGLTVVDTAYLLPGGTYSCIEKMVGV
jgi:hypothetical protein